MARTLVPMHVAKTQLSRLVRQALAGEEVVLCRDDVPVVTLVPVAPPPARRRQPGALAHLASPPPRDWRDFTWEPAELDDMLGDLEDRA